jgi:hypothetical protein
MRIPTMAELQAQAERLTRELEREISQEIDFATNHGTRALTEADIKRISERGADRLGRRMR